MDPKTLRAITRRHFFKQSGFGIGGVALSALLDERLFAQQGDGPFVPRVPHFAPKAKTIIYLFMAGAPTQLDLFDNKPALQKYDGQEIPAEFDPGNPTAEPGIENVKSGSDQMSLDGTPYSEVE